MSGRARQSRRWTPEDDAAIRGALDRLGEASAPPATVTRLVGQLGRSRSAVLARIMKLRGKSPVGARRKWAFTPEMDAALERAMACRTRGALKAFAAAEGLPLSVVFNRAVTVRVARAAGAPADPLGGGASTAEDGETRALDAAARDHVAAVAHPDWPPEADWQVARVFLDSVPASIVADALGQRIEAIVARWAVLRGPAATASKGRLTVAGTRALIRALQARLPVAQTA